MMSLDSEALVEIIKLYKDSPCLWNQTHLLYNNKEARRKAYDILLDKMNISNDSATLNYVRKKIENMRTTYRRELKKIMASKAKGEDNYHPTLWYFNLMSFLHEGSNGENTSNLTLTEMDDGDDEETPSDFAFEEYLDNVPKQKQKKEEEEKTEEERKKRKNNNLIPKPKISGAFLPNDHKEEIEINTLSDNNESVSFGKTVGMQLRELDHVQRIIAEKLISDTIFHARLIQLRTNSTIHLNSDFEINT